MGYMTMHDGIEPQEPITSVEKEQQIIKLTATNRMLVAALYEALEFRGLMAALHDPLMLDGEKKEKRERWKKIELSIRAAIERADSLEKVRKKGF